MKTIVLVLTVLLSLVGCGGASVGSINTGSVSQTVAGTEEKFEDLIAVPLSHSVEIADIDYQNVRNLGGTGKGGTISPKDMRKHYSIPDTATGKGQTIAIVGAKGLKDPLADLNRFSREYGLPECNATNPCFREIDLSNGKLTGFGWEKEIALDIEWAHAIAPEANIVLVTAATRATFSLIDALKVAAAQPGVIAISVSWGCKEITYETNEWMDSVLKGIMDKGITIFAAAGDDGNTGGSNSILWPAVSPYVVGVGGTTIVAVASDLPTTETEMGWRRGGGGISKFEPKPAFQKDVMPDVKMRVSPDVAYNADWDSSMVAIEYSDASLPNGRWGSIGGTSAGAPQWAAILALVAQQATKDGLNWIETMKKFKGGLNEALYTIKSSTTKYTGFFDVTKGNNNWTPTPTCAICNAKEGYDAVTGNGVPNVKALLELV